MSSVDYYPICISANDCGKLLIPLNGSLLGNQTTFPNFVTFSCDEGFLLRGSKVRHCQANKTWTGTAASCDGKEGTFNERFTKAVVISLVGPISQKYWFYKRCQRELDITLGSLQKMFIQVKCDASNLKRNLIAWPFINPKVIACSESTDNTFPLQLLIVVSLTLQEMALYLAI